MVNQNLLLLRNLYHITALLTGPAGGNANTYGHQVFAAEGFAVILQGGFCVTAGSLAEDPACVCIANLLLRLHS